MPGPSASKSKTAGLVFLLDGNVLYALIDESHVHHAPARLWLSNVTDGFATYLASLARRHKGKLASLDKGLVALHSDLGVAFAVEA